jgi:arylformamidase
MKIVDISMNIGDFVFPENPDSQPKGPFNRVSGDNPEYVYDLEICTQSGTHIQGPHYFLKEGKKISDFPLERFMGDAVIINIHKRGEDTSLEEMKQLISVEEGKDKILILRTGHMEELIRTQVLDPKTRPGLSLQ